MNENRFLYRFIQHYAIWFILALALLLRLFKINEMALTNDELSALSRCNYNSLKDLINIGVVELDMHPPFVQIFIYYYTKLFGLNPVIYKLPFITIGILTLWITYKLLTQLFNKHTALLVALFMATSQYFMVHSQTARMYAPGLLFTLLFVSTLFNTSTQNKKFIWAAVYLFLVANTHYMALVTCAFAGIIYLVVYQQEVKKWLLSFGAAAALFALEFPLLIPQFKQGGLSWLGVPDKNYIYYYLQYVAQYTTPILWFVFLGLITVIVALFSKKELHKRNITFSLLLFLTSFAFPYLYSQWRAPIMQYSVLLFGIVFLLAVAFYVYSKLHQTLFMLVFIGLMLMNTHALINTRKHYQVFYHQAYKASVMAMKPYTKNGTTTFLAGNRKYYFDYYFNFENMQPNVVSAKIDTLGYAYFYNWLLQHKPDTLIISHGGAIPYEYASIASIFYSHKLVEKYQSLSETFVFSNRKQNVFPDSFSVLVSAENNRANETKFEFNRSSNVVELEVWSWIKTTDSLTNPILEVALLDDNNQVLYYGTTSLDKFKNTSNQIAPIILRPRIELPENASSKLMVKAAILNEGKHTFKCTPLKVSAKKGNGIIYSTLAPVLE
jgi:uncharacterized membrane protein